MLETWEASLLDAYRLMQAGAEALTEVEEHGICIDVNYCKEKIAWIDSKISQHERRLARTKLGEAWRDKYGNGIKYGSDHQARQIIYGHFKSKQVKSTGKGEASVDEEALRQIEIEGIDNLLQARSYKKMREVLDGFMRYQVAGRIYPYFSLHTVSTYRSSSQNPNLQNVPHRDKEQMDVCRRAIIPSPGNVLLEVDFSGIEVSIAACYHKDPRMIKYLEDPTSDMHADEAKEIFFFEKYQVKDLKKMDNFGTLRQASKNGFVFPEFYGDYYESCAYNVACSWCKLPRERLWQPSDGIMFNNAPIATQFINNGIEGINDFIQHMKAIEQDFWGNRFPVYYKWRKKWYEKYQKHGWFNMKTGFQCKGVFGRNQVTNYPVQGAAFHCLLWSLIQLVNELRGSRSWVVGEIHDSALIDVHPDELRDVVSLANDICTVRLPKHWDWINIPMRVEAKVSEVNGSWANMKVVH